MNIVYRVAEVDSVEEIENFMKVHYVKDEPLCQSLQWNDDDKLPTQHCKPILSAGTCMLAFADNKLVGVRIGGPHLDIKPEEFEMNETTGKLLKMLTLMHTLETVARVGSRYNVAADKIYHGLMLSVHVEARGNSIGIELYRKTMELARAKGYELYVCDCTSFYSARLCEKLGMELVNVLPYPEYCDDDGKPVFQPPPPHTAVKTYAIRL